MSIASLSALSGMRAADLHMQSAGHNIANLATKNFQRQRVDLGEMTGGQGVAATLARESQYGPQIERDMVDMLQAKNGFLANLAVFQAGDQMMGSLLKALA